MVAEVRFERTSLAYETKLEPSPVYSAVTRFKIWFRQMESNPIRPPTVRRHPIELHWLEPKRGFELRSGRYECPVLPIELLRLERVRRIELRWLDWQSSAQPMSHTR